MLVLILQQDVSCLDLIHLELLHILNILWNILGMYTVGFAAVLAGGCPLRQLILAGQGSSDSAVTVVGMFVGAAICHNFGLAASGTALNPETKKW